MKNKHIAKWVAGVLVSTFFITISVSGHFLFPTPSEIEEYNNENEIFEFIYNPYPNYEITEFQTELKKLYLPNGEANWYAIYELMHTNCTALTAAQIDALLEVYLAIPRGLENFIACGYRYSVLPNIYGAPEASYLQMTNTFNTMILRGAALYEEYPSADNLNNLSEYKIKDRQERMMLLQWLNNERRLLPVSPFADVELEDMLRDPPVRIFHLPAGYLMFSAGWYPGAYVQRGDGYMIDGNFVNRVQVGRDLLPIEVVRGIGEPAFTEQKSFEKQLYIERVLNTSDVLMVYHELGYEIGVTIVDGVIDYQYSKITIGREAYLRIAGFEKYYGVGAQSLRDSLGQFYAVLDSNGNPTLPSTGVARDYIQYIDELNDAFSPALFEEELYQRYKELYEQKFASEEELRETFDALSAEELAVLNNGWKTNTTKIHQ